MTLRIVCTSGNRADRNALTPVAKALNAEWVYVDTLPSRDNFDSAISCGQAMMMAAEQLQNKKPDLVVLAGDRYEILGAACAAHLLNIPIAHLSGGDVTEGSQDDAMRNAITKLAHLHFPTNEQSAQRIIDMGEEAGRVHTVGCPAIDHIKSLTLYSQAETVMALEVPIPYILVAYQPATLARDPVAEAGQLLFALESTYWPCIFTTVNTDAYGVEITKRILKFCRNGRGKILDMDSKLYLSAMKYCQVMVGNSSSGLYEAPTLKTPFVNIGDRQKGRITASSVINCIPTAGRIYEAFCKAKTLDCSDTVNPYGDGGAAERISAVVKGAESWLLSKNGKQPMHNEIGGNTLLRKLCDSAIKGARKDNPFLTSVQEGERQLGLWPEKDLNQLQSTGASVLSRNHALDYLVKDSTSKA